MTLMEYLYIGSVYMMLLGGGFWFGVFIYDLIHKWRK